MKRPVILDSRYVKPITFGSTEKCMCAKCATESALWLIGKDPNAYRSCAYCFLYGTDWGKENSEGIKELVMATEGRMGRPISVDGVAVREEADRILQAIVMTSAIKRGRSAGASGYEGPGA